MYLNMQESTPKKAFQLFKPESCVFVISVKEDGSPSGMVAGWQMKCSIDPPLFAVSLSKKGFTHKLIQQSKEFVVAVPNESLTEEVKYFGSVHGDEEDKFNISKIETEKAHYVKTPLISRATINFECKLYKQTDSGDHIIFIGEILAAHVNEDSKVLLNVGGSKGDHVFKEF
jgi:flavin reductase (DIM6/NTAB) family NADH-FMN oxidoreductase RutF